jgi:hypothetical protein
MWTNESETGKTYVPAVEQPIVYISGPMTGYPFHNYPAFHAAEQRLAMLPVRILNPARNYGGRTDLPREQYMRMDLENVLRADVLYMLRGWEESNGALLEHNIARELGLQIVYEELGVLGSLLAMRLATVDVPAWGEGGRIGYPSTPPKSALDKMTPPWEDFADSDGYASTPDVNYIYTLDGSKRLFTVPGLQPAYFGPEQSAGPSPDYVPEELVLLETDETILQEADRIVAGDRGSSYGHPYDDFTRTGRMWGAILGTPDVSPEQVGLCMVALKVSREVNRHKRDNLVDIGGYAKTVDLVVQERQRLAESA